MKIPCIRCGLEIESANDHNADYIYAPDTIVPEEREILVAVRHTQETALALVEKGEFDIAECERIEVDSFVDAATLYGSDLIRVEAHLAMKDIQKTGIVCPACYNPETDTVIWGFHKSIWGWYLGPPVDA